MILSKNYADLFTISLRNDDIQEFDSKWDGILLSMTKITPDDILEGLYKLRIRGSEKLKTVLELYDARGHITKREDETIHTTTWTTHHQTPRRNTTQHSTSWRSAADAILLGHREITGGSRQDTHGTPVLITIRRPWVAQPQEHAQATRDARHTLRATMVLNTETGGDLQPGSGVRVQIACTWKRTRNMVAEPSCEPRQSTIVHGSDVLTSRML